MTPFGTLEAGPVVHRIRLAAHGLRASILTYGAIVQDVRLDGVPHSLTVGSEHIADYETTMAMNGAIAGPVANRITGARAVIGGIEHMLDPNLRGQHTLHSGRRGLHKRVWSVVDHGADFAELQVTLPDGDGGFPGNRDVTARFEITDGPTLHLTITTTTDAPTIANATNHSYWNLDGSGRMNDHRLQIFADHYLPSDENAFVTGDVVDVEQTSFDFRAEKPLVLGETRFDNTFCLGRSRSAMRPALKLSTDAMTLEVSTTEAGIHIYDYAPKFTALAIEAQSWPDAGRHAHFPSIDVLPGTPCVQKTSWRFTRT